MEFVQIASSGRAFRTTRTFRGWYLFFITVEAVNEKTPLRDISRSGATITGNDRLS